MPATYNAADMGWALRSYLRIYLTMIMKPLP